MASLDVGTPVQVKEDPPSSRRAVVANAGKYGEVTRVVGRFLQDGDVPVLLEAPETEAAVILAERGDLTLSN